MTDVDPLGTQRDRVPDILALLRQAGFEKEIEFEHVKEIEHGGFGVVYRCAEPVLDRTIAVKLLTSDLDPDNLDRFMREQHAMGRLSARLRCSPANRRRWRRTCIR